MAIALNENSRHSGILVFYFLPPEAKIDGALLQGRTILSVHYVQTSRYGNRDTQQRQGSRDCRGFAPWER